MINKYEICKIECFVTSPQSSPKRRGSSLFSFSSIGEGRDEVDIIKKLKRRISYVRQKRKKR